MLPDICCTWVWLNTEGQSGVPWSGCGRPTRRSRPLCIRVWMWGGWEEISSGIGKNQEAGKDCGSPHCYGHNSGPGSHYLWWALSIVCAVFSEVIAYVPTFRIWQNFPAFCFKFRHFNCNCIYSTFYGTMYIAQCTQTLVYEPRQPTAGTTVSVSAICLFLPARGLTYIVPCLSVY